MPTDQETKKQLPAGRRGLALGAVLLLALTLAAAVVLFQPFSATRIEPARTARQTAAKTCGVAVTGEVDVSGECR